MKEIDTELAFKQIKKQNGEAVAKLLRSEILLDIPNLAHILEFAGNNPDKIKALAPVIREIYKTQTVSEYQTDKNPLLLLSEAGYDAFVVTNAKEKNSIKKYYRNGEEICTFSDPDRHKNYYMIHAVKRGADKIKPSNNPEREDEYGTSVISIQIAKGGGFISIKNRYNHTVNDPDATFNNNPDNIIPGLSTSLKKYFDVDFSVSKSMMPDNFRTVHEQFVYFNYEINNIYFGPNYYFSGSTITKLNTDYEIMLDYYVLNVKTGEVRDVAGLKDQTHKILQDMFQNKKITIRTNPNNKHEHMIYADDAHVLSVGNGTITELNLPNIKCIGDNFLMQNQNLRKLYASKLESVGYQFLLSNTELTELDLPSLEYVGDSFLFNNQKMRTFNAPKLKIVGGDFLYFNYNLRTFNAPKLKIVGGDFLCDNTELIELDLPSLENVGINFLYYNQNLQTFNAPKLESVGNGFLSRNTELTELDLPSLKSVGNGFLFDNKKMQTFNAAKLKSVGGDFLRNNTELTELDLPSLENVSSGFLFKNHNLQTLNVPKLESVEGDFLYFNYNLRTFNAPKLKSVGGDFLRNNTELTELDLPSLENVSSGFLFNNHNLRTFNAPKLESVGYQFLLSNTELTELDLPSLKSVGGGFLFNNHKLQTFNVPELESVEGDFLYFNYNLRTFNAPKLKSVGDDFLRNNTELTELVVGNKDLVPKQLAMILAKNKIKQKMKDTNVHMINMVVHSDNNKL